MYDQHADVISTHGVGRPRKLPIAAARCSDRFPYNTTDCQRLHSFWSEAGYSPLVRTRCPQEVRCRAEEEGSAGDRARRRKTKRAAVKMAEEIEAEMDVLLEKVEKNTVYSSAAGQLPEGSLWLRRTMWAAYLKSCSQTPRRSLSRRARAQSCRRSGRPP